MGKFRGNDTDDGWINRKFADLQRQITENAAVSLMGLRSEVRQADITPVILTPSFTVFGTISVTPPDGYSFALVQIVATVGASYSSSTAGNVGVQPFAGSVLGLGQSNGGGGGVGGAGNSAAASLATKLTVAGVPFDIGVRAYGTGYDAGTANLRYSAVIIYTRG